MTRRSQGWLPRRAQQRLHHGRIGDTLMAELMFDYPQWHKLIQLMVAMLLRAIMSPSTIVACRLQAYNYA